MPSNDTYTVTYKDGTSIQFNKMKGVRKVKLRRNASSSGLTNKMVPLGVDVVKLSEQSHYLLYDNQENMNSGGLLKKHYNRLKVMRYFKTVGSAYRAKNKFYIGKNSLVLIPVSDLTKEQVTREIGNRGVVKHKSNNCFVIECDTEEIMKKRVNELNQETWVAIADPNFSNLETIPEDRQRNITDARRFINMTVPPQSSHKILNAVGRPNGKSAIKIGIFDTGIDREHFDLKEALNNQPHFDAIAWDHDPYPFNRNAHGTLCAGIAGARKKHQSGVNGIGSGCSIIDYRICLNAKSSDGFFNRFEYDLYSLINAFNIAAFTHEVDVISCSWGVGQSYKSLEYVLKNVSENGRNSKGLPIVFSAGNGESEVNFPASSPYVITVAAVDRQKIPLKGRIDNEIYYPGSNYGDNVDIAAIGTEIVTTDMLAHYGRVSLSLHNFNYDKNFGGTSAAAPQVAGCIGLMISKNSELKLEDIKGLLTDKRNLTAFGETPQENFGAGILNVLEILSKINVT